MSLAHHAALAMAIGPVAAAPAAFTFPPFSFPPFNFPTFSIPNPFAKPTTTTAVTSPGPTPTIFTTTNAPVITTSSSAPTTSTTSTTKTSSKTSSAAPTATGFTVGAAVDTTSGRIVGHPAFNATGVSEYLGIPYALPPTGDRRFAAPVAYRGSNTINASSFGLDCPSVPPAVPPVIQGTRLGNLLQDLAQTNDTLGEDCLFVNVWTKPQTGSKKKPVLVWIFGGGFNFGGTNVRAYNGKYFADQEDVVLVSFNYRSNILGFSGAPGITQNVGLLDQRLAIEWIRDNIGAFGGDASRITLFGQSAGGMSIDLYNYAYVNDPIIKGTILQSGNVNSYVIRQPQDAADSWYSASTQLGCGNETTSTAAAVLACMRSSKTSWQDIERVSNPKKGLASLLGSYGPTIDNKVVFSNYRALSSAGNFTNVPALIGNTNYEAGLLILIAAGAGEVYPQNVWDSIDQSVFTCPASYASRDRATLGRPVWRYFYGGMYPNLVIPTANISQAWHTSDIPTLFGTSEDSTLEAATPPQVGLGNYIRKAWATFAANPTTGLSSAPFNWPQYNPSANTLILLGQNNATTAAYGLAADVDQGC